MFNLKKIIIGMVIILLTVLFVLASDIHQAAKEGDLAKVKALLEKNEDLAEAKNKKGETPLHSAASGGQLEVVKFLVSKGVDINLKENNGATALHLACYYGHRDAVEWLIDHGADKDVGDGDGSTPIFWAVHGGHKNIVELLIARGSDVNSKDNNSITPLRIAVFRGNKEIIDLLIDKGAEVNAKNESGATPLHEACVSGNKDVVELLIRKGTDIGIEDNSGNTTLHFASNHGHEEIVELLIAKGADVNKITDGGDTPLHGAAWGNHKEIVEFLMAKGAKLRVKNKIGRTPLDNAIWLNRKEIVELMIAKYDQRKTDKQAAQEEIMESERKNEGQKDPVKFTILYDNYVFQKGTKSDWGFSCLIEGTEKTILFDTGTRSEILFHNIDRLKVDLNKVEQIVISHIHSDHTGGLSAVLDKNHDVQVYLPISFPYEFIRRVENKRAKVKSVKEPVKICRHVYLTGEMGNRIKEQSLIINTSKGLVIVTGCSHQGIVNILKRAKELFDRQIYLVFGGFHLGSKSDEELKEIIRNFKEMGVKKCGATHCTGDRAIELFKDAYKEDYVPMGTGKILEIGD